MSPNFAKFSSNIYEDIAFTRFCGSSLAKRLSLSTKLRIYQRLVLSVLLYASETWTVLAANTGSLESFHMKCQRHILGSDGMILSVTLR